MPNSTQPRHVTHQTERQMPGSADYIVRSHYSDGSWTDRRYNGSGFQTDVPRIFTVADTELGSRS